MQLGVEERGKVPPILFIYCHDSTAYFRLSRPAIEKFLGSVILLLFFFLFSISKIHQEVLMLGKYTPISVDGKMGSFHVHLVVAQQFQVISWFGISSPELDRKYIYG